MPLVHRGYSVHIESEGKELTQYQVEAVDERTITCWIPSQSGKAFSVKFSTVERHDHQHFSADLYADGRRLSGVGGEDDDEDVWEIDDRRISETSTQPFLFSEVHIASDDDTITTQPKKIEKVATVELKIWVGKRETHDTIQLCIEDHHELDNGLSISESSKLIGVNHVKPGAVKSLEFSSETESYVSYGRVGKHPYAVFRFKHRPPAVLQAMGIMPRPAQSPCHPAASASTSTVSRKRSHSVEYMPHKRRRVKEEERDIKPVIDDELEAKRRRLQAEIIAEQAEAAARQARAAVLQAQLEEAEAAARARRGRVKSERRPSPICVPRSGEVIDLTDD
ncbi:hypothetical protein PENSPDRAFT_693674 [Peniophora sp. CONT]|nr:hypothetical protein PENSPDRAFT_693674 [Peniophora sp. CONT]